MAGQLPAVSASATPSTTPSKLKVGGAGQSQEGSLKRKRGIFSKDLRLMMYGFGDDPDPIPETVMLMEDILIDYITDMIHKSQDVASRRGKLSTEDIMFLVRKVSCFNLHVLFSAL
ncbi:hypothetical protein O6H91_01G173500 [Diphasiastrum complanatum]|uniref:Uncharacterized protein n=1 Tax=Diphasiastrum complanatum TaxID=34168 RepID=A0ACC2EZ11_DIPCM|nr:hypothetical protein O6H91_01G173500 [Diphasiastrum complanatum]